MTSDSLVFFVKGQSTLCVKDKFHEHNTSVSVFALCRMDPHALLIVVILSATGKMHELNNLSLLMWHARNLLFTSKAYEPLGMNHFQFQHQNIE